MPVRGGDGTLRPGSITPGFISFHLISQIPLNLLWESQGERFLLHDWVITKCQRLGGGGKGEEDAFREYMGMQRKLRRQGLICEGLGIQDDPTELPATQWLLIPPGLLPTWPAPTWPAPTWHTHRCAGSPGRALGRATAVTLLILQAGPSPTHCFYTRKIKRAELGISGQRIKMCLLGH